MPLKTAAALSLLVLLCAGAARAQSTDDATYASYACQQHALKALQALGKPRFDPAPPARLLPVGDPRRPAGADAVWEASGALYTQVRFGGPLQRAEFRCTLHKPAAAGWKLIELAWPQGRPWDKPAG